jgi:hypothetical protein
MKLLLLLFCMFLLNDWRLLESLEVNSKDKENHDNSFYYTEILIYRAVEQLSTRCNAVTIKNCVPI